MTPPPLGRDHLEANAEEFLRKEVRKLGGYAFKWVPVVAGLPDRLVLLPGGRVFFVEMKQRGKKPANLQRVWHARFRRLGFHVAVLDSKDAVRRWLAEIDIV